MEKVNCPFCEPLHEDRVVYSDSTFTVIYDGYPVSNGHVLIIPNRHVETYFDLNEVEASELGIVIGIVKNILDDKFHPDGYNIGINCGKAAGQTVNHCHIHLIPRYNGDIDDPRGGIRGVIPSKQKY